MESIIFSDGASKGNPGNGGWGAIVATDEKVVELGGFATNVTNNQMELLAAIEALKCAKSLDVQDCVLHTDSAYVINGITKWIHGWKKNGWKTSTGTAVINKQLWEDLINLAHQSDLKIKWVHVGGHIGIQGNERVDAIASDFAEKKKVELYSGSKESYGVDVSNIKFDEVLKSNKSKTKSKAPAYSYVSEVGGVVSIHKTWAECQARTTGKKARFKKATSPTEEKQIIIEFSV
jgi:ribonuclease HI